MYAYTHLCMHIKIYTHVSYIYIYIYIHIYTNPYDWLDPTSLIEELDFESSLYRVRGHDKSTK